jgi:hypothetical protein
MYGLDLAAQFDGLGDSIVVGVAHAADRGLDARFRQVTELTNGHMLGGLN